MKLIIQNIVVLLVGLVFFVGFPIIGWGIKDTDHFFSAPSRTGYIFLILILQLVAVFYNPPVKKTLNKNKKDEKKIKIDLILIQLFSIAIVLIAPISDKHTLLVLNYGGIYRFMGYVFIVSGFILMQTAEKYLDKQFSVQVTIQADHDLIQDGPYKIIRHPRYLGIIAFFIGISLVFRSLFSLLFVFALAIVLVWRVYAEESLLHREFKNEWENYCTTTWRLIPFIF